MESRRLLIVNADDFGLARGVNRGIAEAHEHGIVTSASLMVNGEAAADAAAYARGREELSVGLHVELGQPRLPRLRRKNARRAEISPTRAGAELEAQLERFRSLVGRDPTHLDSHHHQHRAAALRPVFAAVADELGVPLRHFDPRIRFRGDFYGQTGTGAPEPEAITPDALVRLLEQVSERITELGCHPGYADGLRSWYRDERSHEVRALCDPRVRAAIDRLQLRLVSFADVRRSPSAGPPEAHASHTAT